jgi:hypothetical protein
VNVISDFAVSRSYNRRKQTAEPFRDRKAAFVIQEEILIAR